MILVEAKYKTPVLKFSGIQLSQQVLKYYFSTPCDMHVMRARNQRRGRNGRTQVWDLRELVSPANLWLLALKSCGQVSCLIGETLWDF